MCPRHARDDGRPVRRSRAARIERPGDRTERAAARRRRTSSRAQIFFLRREQGRLAEMEEAMRRRRRAVPDPAGLARARLPGCTPRSVARPRRRASSSRAAEHDFRDVPQDNNWLASVTILAEVCALLGDRRRARGAHERLLPHAELVVVAGIASACGGAVARPLGLLAATLGRWEEVPSTTSSTRSPSIAISAPARSSPARSSTTRRRCWRRVEAVNATARRHAEWQASCSVRRMLSLATWG